MRTLWVIAAVLAFFVGPGLAAEEPPTEWIDPSTGHRIARLSREAGSASLYFNQNAYTADGNRLLITTPGGLSFSWGIEGCPHVGGALVCAPPSAGTNTGGRVFASVWTAKDGQSHGDYFLSSVDAGRSWSAPTRMGGTESWHADLAGSGDRLAMVWDAYMDGTTGVFVSVSNDAGRNWLPPIRLSSERVSATHPRVIGTSQGFRMFWTQREGDEPVKWVMRGIP